MAVMYCVKESCITSVWVSVLEKASLTVFVMDESYLRPNIILPPLTSGAVASSPSAYIPLSACTRILVFPSPHILSLHLFGLRIGPLTAALPVVDLLCQVLYASGHSRSHLY